MGSMAKHADKGTGNATATSRGGAGSRKVTKAVKPAGAATTLKTSAVTMPQGTAPSLRERRRELKVSIARENILDATELLFGDRGYQGTSIEQIAVASEFSVGAIYTFFDNKKALLAAVLQRRSREQIDFMNQALNDPSSGVDQLLNHVSSIMRFFQQHPAYARLSIRVHGAALEPLSDFVSFRQSFEDGLEVFVTAIENGQQDGSIRQCDPRWLSRMVTALIMSHHSMSDAAQSDGFPHEDLLDLVRAAITPPKR
jgi:AcrR family transcriptional regulator